MKSRARTRRKLVYDGGPRYRESMRAVLQNPFVCQCFFKTRNRIGVGSESIGLSMFFYGGRTKRVFLGARTKVNFLSNIFDIGRLRFGIICDEYVLFETKPRERKRNNKRTQSRTEILIYIKCVYLRDLKVEDKYSIISTEDFIKVLFI